MQGKDRDKVSATAQAIAMDTFIPRSYIEQVQLEKLTHDFQSFTEDVKKRFSVNGESVLDESYMMGSSPVLRSSGERFLTRFMSLSSSLPERVQMSTSAPIPISGPRGHRVTGRGESSGVGGASGSGGRHEVFSNGRGGERRTNGGGGLLGQQLHHMRASPGSGVISSSGEGDSKGSQHISSPPRHLAGLPDSGPALSSGGVPARVQDQLDMLSEHVRRYSGLQLQMDAMIHQYRQMNDQIAVLSTATQAVQQLLQHQHQQPSPALQQTDAVEQGTYTSSSSNTAVVEGGLQPSRAAVVLPGSGNRAGSVGSLDNLGMLAAVAVTCLASGALLGAAVARRSS